MLALFDISPVKDENGKSIIPSDDSTNGGITYVCFPSDSYEAPH